MPPQERDTIVAIFAKYPRTGRVKTRLAGDSVGDYEALSLDDCATLYEAFLRDYRHRFSTTALAQLGAEGRFCVRPGPDLEAFRRDFGDGALGVLEEPAHQGRAAQDIGQAMGYTIRSLLAEGFRKVILLGSDLPHIPLSLIAEARDRLEQAPLVLGHDGGGCYSIAASAPAPLLEDGQIPWSEGKDFAAICDAQRAAGQTPEVLSQVLEDIDTPDALHRLTKALASGHIEESRIPHTYQVLQGWGWLSSREE